MSRIPYHSDDKLQEEAEAFLKRYHATGSLPVPIEAIVEFDVGLEIVPVPSLLSKFNMDGALSSDLRTLTVDQDVMKRSVNRYHFTLAHEIGHWWLHADFIRSRKCNSIRAWRTAMAAVPQETYKRLEVQANGFASFVLVPADAFQKELSHLSHRMHGSELVAGLSSKFEVSSQVIEFRLNRLSRL